jgi:alpha-glucosidase (family GH31 glycosyl hydrolase)
MVVEDDGKASGTLILNSNAQEYVTGPGPHIIYRSLGGMFDLYFFPGPKPEDVIHQYLDFIGHPMLPAYWSFGFQLCKYGYKNLDEVKSVVSRTKNAGIPQDVQYIDIDYMDQRQDFTYDHSNFNGLPDYVRQLQSQGMSWIFILDPAIPTDYPPFVRGRDKDVYIKWPSREAMSAKNKKINDMYESSRGTHIMLGTVWPDNNTAFPDWWAPNTNDWWKSEVQAFHQTVPFNGIWIDMNEPANFGTNSDHPWYCGGGTGHKCTPAIFCDSDSKLDFPPYPGYASQGGSMLSAKTICMVGTHANGQTEYNMHNMFGWGESRATSAAVKAATGMRGTVISRSTFPSSGVFAGHWLGDNSASWDNHRVSLIGAMEFNMFGIPYIGADVCGFNGAPSEELCLRWQQAGAFYSFYRNHNGKGYPDQDPARWPSVAAATKKANFFRYHYLPYLHSLHFKASLEGHTVTRPLFFEFTTDPKTLTIDQQALWGDAIMFSPVFTSGASSVDVYFPQGETWYTISEIDYASAVGPGTHTIQAPRDKLIPVHLRSGKIVPRQAPAMTTTEARKNPMELLIGVGASSKTASGFLFWDDGNVIQDLSTSTSGQYMYLTFDYSENGSGATLTIKKIRGDAQINSLDIIEVLGYGHNPNWNSFKWNGSPVQVDQGSSHADPGKKLLYIKTNNFINLNSFSGTATLTWSHY